MIYASQGVWDEAYAQFKEALTLKEHPYTLFAASYCLNKLGRREEAEACRCRARQMCADEQEAEKAAAYMEEEL